jgi:hypothetical protein
MAEPNPFANFISGQLNPGLVPRSSLPIGRPHIISDDPLALYRKTMATNLAPNIFDGVTVFRGIVLYTFPVSHEEYSLFRLASGFFGMRAPEDDFNFFSCMIPELHAHLPNPYMFVHKSPEEFISKLELFPIFEPGGTDAYDFGSLSGIGPGAIVEIQFSDPNRTHGYVSRLIAQPDSELVPSIQVSASNAFGSGDAEFVRPGPGVTDCPEYNPFAGGSTSADIMEAYGDSGMTQELADKVEDVANNLGMDPAFLANAMFFESAYTFNPSVIQPDSGAVGLIQFIPSTAAELGTTTEELAGMSAVEQMDKVQEYFELERTGGRLKGGIWSQEDVFMAIYFPEAMGKGPDYSIYDYYERNPMTINGRKLAPKESAEYYKRINNGIETAGDYTALSNSKAKMCS